MNAVKKHLVLAALIGTAVGVTSTQAFAQSNVNIYGGISLALTKATGTPTALNTTGFGNYIGFKGEEALGNGTSAYFEFRNNFSADTGAVNGVLWGEKSFVGIKGGFGSVQFGRFLNAYDDIAFKAFGDTVASEHGLAYSGRNDNTIGYYSPNFNGLTFTATTALKEAAAVANVSSLNAKYANGPLTVGFAYEDASKFFGHNSTLIGGSYDFVVAKVNADYAKASSGSKESNLRLGVSVPMGAGTVKAAFTQGKDTTFKHQFGLGYWHTLSKRTFLFTDVNSTKDSVAGTTTSFDVGINHNF